MMRALLGVGLFVVVLLAIAMPREPDSQRPSTAIVSQATVAPARPDPAKSVWITKSAWEKSGFGSVAIATFTIRNENTFAVRDIEVACEFLGKSGSRINRRTITLYEWIDASKSKTIPKINMGFVDQQATSASCSVAGVKDR
jgi:hypothetical protein